MRRRVLAFLAGVVWVAAGCSGAQKNADGVTGTGGSLQVSSEGDGLLVEKADLDGNGRTDVWTRFREVTGKDGKKTRVVVRKTVDLNDDGRPDLAQVFDEQGDLVREEVDLDFDGRIDMIRHFKKGKVESEEVSSLFDGRFDVRKYYEDGVLVLKQVDTRHAGRFDEFQYFVGSKLYRIGWDRDGDGKPEVFEENPAVE